MIAHATNFIDIDASTDNNTLKSVLASYYVAIKADVLLLTIKRNNNNKILIIITLLLVVIYPSMFIRK